jgi:hypothetical protein
MEGEMEGEIAWPSSPESLVSDWVDWGEELGLEGEEPVYLF